MGYRIRLGKILKTAKDKYSGKSYEEILKLLNDESPVYALPEYKQIYEIGKYFDISKYKKESFFSFNISSYEEDFWIISKNTLKQIIFDYSKEICETFKKAYESNDNERYKSIVRGYYNEWSHINDIPPFWLDEKDTDGDIVRSWNMDYAIFNIVYIYRFFDFENNYLILSGW